ncbi:MAG TPA: hypothetical protein VFQ47_08985 [Nitrososphaera sp.]|jgi:hypothetical protein|nr:hypothetical protein [Nitrososphaera sp.]
MQFTDAQISKQEDFVNVLAFKQEASFYAASEARRTFDEDTLKLREAKALLEIMLSDKSK